MKDVPLLPLALLRRLLPPPDRDEVIAELASEYRTRAAAHGRPAALRWLWRQVLGSAPALVRRRWWRGWSGFEPRADWARPGGGVIEGTAMDLKYALRRLRSCPTHTLLCVFTLALGVAGAAAVFGVGEELLWKPLPVADEEEVGVFWAPGTWSAQEFLHIRPDLEGFASAAAYWQTDLTLRPADGPAVLVNAVSASAELFDVLGVSPTVGPGFRPGDDRVGGEPVAVLSHSLWRQLGADPSIIGRTIELAGLSRTVVGVMPPGFWFPDPTVDVWQTMVMHPDDPTLNFHVIGRVDGGRAAGTGPVAQRIAARLGERFDYVNERWDKTRNAQLVPLREFLVGPVRPALVALLAAVAAILAIACVNVAALMLGQVDIRETELAVKSALGGARSRLLRQIVLESLVIGVLAGIAGAGAAALGFPFLVNALPLGALAEVATIDWTVLWAALGLGLVAATAVSLVPAWSIARADLRANLVRARTSGIAGRGGRLEGGLVVVQVALAFLMIAGAALLVRTVANLRSIDAGVDTRGIGVIDIVMPYTTSVEERARIVADAVASLTPLPGLESVAATQRLPLRGPGNYMRISVEQRPELEPTVAAFRVVTPDYFRTLGIELRAGRALLDTDRLLPEDGVVVINEELARRYLPGTDPIGARIGFGFGRWDRIVGVVADVAESRLTDAPEPARYVLYEHAPFGINPWQTIVFRARDGVDPTTLLDAARRALQTAVPAVAIRETTTMRRVVERAMGPALQVQLLLSALALIGLALGVIGVYGVVSHFALRRRRDWGIRIALGMRPDRVLRRIVASAATLVSGGILLGTGAFLALARLFSSLLYGVGTADPAGLAAAAFVLLASGAVAATIPALRASRIDPATILRED